MGVLAEIGVRDRFDVDCVLVPDAADLERVFRVFDFAYGVAVIFFVSFWWFVSGGVAVRSVSDMLCGRTIQFVGMSAFHTRISDPVIGGTYMTVCPPSAHYLNVDLSPSCIAAPQYLHQPRRNMAKILRSQRSVNPAR